MAGSDRARIVDLSEVQLRLAMVRAGVWLTVAVCLIGALYAGFTWEAQNRPFILAMLGVGLAGGLAIAVLPIERILRTRAAEPFFVVWSVLDIVVIALIVGADGGATSPFTVVFFLPMVFAALSYPLGSFVLVGALDVLAFVAVAVTVAHTETSYIAFVAACLGSTAVMCAWQAQNHDRQRGLLNDISRTDPLTGCLNRRGFEERIEAELAQAQRSGQPVSLMLLDLDGFKEVNDRVGHAAGDELLCWVTNGINEAVRPPDTVGRLGGDEFAILSTGAPRADAEAIAARVRDLLSERIPVGTGVASFPEDAVDVDELYRTADIRLYDMKNGHGGLVPSGRRELSWAAALARAVDVRMGVLGEHQVAMQAAGIASRLGWHGEQLASLRMAAMIRDVGKVPIPDRILQKPGPLDEREYDEVKRHPVVGAEMVSRVDGVEGIAPWIRHSHENFDGSGYPDGLSGDQIPLAARVLRVVDAYDAMTSDRPYRHALSREAALESLRRSSGRAFDPRCVEMLEDYLREEAISSAAQSAACSTSERTFSGGSAKRPST